jgi:hypothetical protein
MNLASVWKSRRAGKKKSVHKPKIRWQLLGLTDPNVDNDAHSIETIRQEVSELAKYGFGPLTAVRSASKGSKPLRKIPK